MNNDDKNEMMSQEMVTPTLVGAISSRNLWHQLLPGASSPFCPDAPVHSWQHRNRISRKCFAPRKASGHHFARHHFIYFIFSFFIIFHFQPSQAPRRPASKHGRQRVRGQPASQPVGQRVGKWVGGISWVVENEK